MQKIVLENFAFWCFTMKEKFYWHYLATLKNISVASWRLPKKSYFEPCMSVLKYRVVEMEFSPNRQLSVSTKPSRSHATSEKKHLFLPCGHCVAGSWNRLKHGGAWIITVLGAINSNHTFIFDLNYLLWKLKTSKRQVVMYQSNRSFNIPPRAYPFDVFSCPGGREFD